VKRKLQGFTLIEIMVVIVVAAILVGAVAFSFPNTGDDMLKEDAERFSALVSLAQDEAILQSRDLALSINSSGYSFQRREGKTWVGFSEAPFNARKLKGVTQSELFLEGVAIKLKDKAKTKPQIVIYTSGEVTPFSYNLSNQDNSKVTIKVNGVGTIEREFIQYEQ
jgi:general secretion pathway protein H